MRNQTIIIQPIITEKSLKEVAKNRYTFLVAKEADKTAIKKAIKSMFDVDVKAVTVATMRGSRTIKSRFGRKTKSFTYKKARVVLPKDQKIALFEEIAKGDK